MGVWTGIKEAFSTAGTILSGKGLKRTMIEMNERQFTNYGEKRYGINPPQKAKGPAPRS